MKTTKTITAAVAAAALVGAIGFAYAQTSDTATPQGGGTAAMDPQAPATTPATPSTDTPAAPATPADTSSTPAAAPSSTDTTSTPAPAEPAAKPDRN